MAKARHESRPEHGGQVAQAARAWGIPADQWLDLSTGISPFPWPVPDIPVAVWQRLPEEDDGLADVVRHWSGAPAACGCLPVAGSQTAIQQLPQLYPAGRVGVPVPGYQEHGYWWHRAGHEVVPVPMASMGADEAWLDSLDVLVWINPNNPTGLALPAEQLMRWHHRLQARGATLVVDEAFIAHDGDESLAAHAGMPGLVVLRSLGKFFGLAGVRAGAVLGEPALVSALAGQLGPWALSGPARYVMKQALQDVAWQQWAQDYLHGASDRLARLLVSQGLGKSTGTHLFRYLEHPRAARLYQTLAQQGVLVRLFENPAAIRLGLPGSEPEWRRLERALGKFD